AEAGGGTCVGSRQMAAYTVGGRGGDGRKTASRIRVFAGGLRQISGNLPEMELRRDHRRIHRVGRRTRY
ncbi:hypothetical protein P4360_32860, partial [Bacillus thuringiensis]|nr:hypothetical protein [Bacillus thuringiensis]